MDIGGAEFEEKLPRLKELILACDFVSLDMEFTGLHSMFLPDGQPSLFDSPTEWYRKARQSIQRFTVSQLGLSIFSSEKSNKYMAHSYNFFLFPTILGQMDLEFSLQVSSIQFLSHYGFDYNKFLRDGIPYMNEAQEKKLQQHLLSGNWTVLSGFNREKLKKVIDEVTCWVSSAEEEDSMVLHNICGFQLFEIQLVLRRALRDIWTVPLGGQEVMVKKINPQRRWLLENTSYDCCQKEQILLSARGFTSLFQTLIKAKKLLVGHNMLMDLLHLHDKFYKPLPEDYEEFKKNIHSLFPFLLDTKNIAKVIWKEFQFPQASTLLEVYEVLCSDMNPTNSSCPEIFHASDCLRYATKKSPHEAGYDAFLCGSGIDVLSGVQNTPFHGPCANSAHELESSNLLTDKLTLQVGVLVTFIDFLHCVTMKENPPENVSLLTEEMGTGFGAGPVDHRQYVFKRGSHVQKHSENVQAWNKPFCFNVFWKTSVIDAFRRKLHELQV